MTVVRFEKSDFGGFKCHGGYSTVILFIVYTINVSH